LELRHLRYCIAVADGGGFTKAAARLNLAQQALSRQIADLERELGVRLFDRGPRGATLTPAGLAFVAEARVVLEQASRAVDRARAEISGGEIHVAYSYLTAPHLSAMSEIIGVFHQAFPGISVQVEHLPTAAHAAALRAGTIDVGFCYLAEPERDEFASDLFLEDGVAGLILPASHRLASSPTVQLADLAGLPMVVPPRELNPSTYDNHMAALLDRGLHPELAFIRAIGVVGAAAVAEGAWQLVVDSAIEQMAGQPGVVYRRFDGPPLPIGLWLRHRAPEPSPLVERFVLTCLESRARYTAVEPLEGDDALVGSDRPPRSWSAEAAAAVEVGLPDRLPGEP
jgi:DNA-binding transcriptional LysR family regulator